MDSRIEAALPYLEGRGITSETAERFMLSYDERQNAILIPYFDASGRLQCVNQRNLDWAKGQRWPPKYTRTHGPSHLFNVRAVDSSTVYLCEGEFDAVILEQTGRSAVGVPGVNNFKPEWAWLFSEKKVRVCFDADPPKKLENGKILRAGQQGAYRVRQWLNKVSDDVEILDFPEGEDVSSLYIQDRLEGVIG